ncbi:CapA family protein [Serpentinicella sp. ANB-PHB4]|uniref:CapA family protein n=1 Tax=Serpentinicella sp. ANB-PHB4 TaxID=3074076 RepID=UPI00285BFAD0|nr:CapA family protein [Serpentinicella sp. ANB-PHB4]MDR5658796.1 CapA family protein [Serpentinicella sp. ANB-PHB4]
MNKKLTIKEKFLKIKKRHRKNTNWHVSMTLVVTLVLMVTFNLFTSASPKIITVNNDDTLLSLTMVGDIQLGHFIEREGNRKGFNQVFSNVADLLNKSDYVTGTMENADNTTVGQSREFLKALQSANFQNINLGTNSMTIENTKEAISSLNTVGLDYVGIGSDILDAQNILYQDINGVRVATLGFNQLGGNYAGRTNPGTLPALPNIFMPLMREANENADLVVVHVHWGDEFASRPNDRQIQLAEQLTDLGADIIIGNNPNVIQPMEMIGDTLVFYSLGNFIYEQTFSTRKEGVIAKLDIDNNGNGRLELIPTWLNEGKPTPLTGRLDFYRRNRVIKGITRDLNKEAWTVEDNKVIIQLGDMYEISQENELNLDNDNGLDYEM